jgi:hypothetical protein
VFSYFSSWPRLTSARFCADRRLYAPGSHTPNAQGFVVCSTTNEFDAAARTELLECRPSVLAGKPPPIALIVSTPRVKLRARAALT